MATAIQNQMIANENERRDKQQQRELDAKENARKKEADKETARHNKVTETQGWVKQVSDTLGKTAGVAKDIGALAMLAGKNHPEWYNRVPDLVNNVAKLSSDFPKGTIHNYTSIYGSENASQPAKFSLPGIHVVEYTPTLGTGDSGTIFTATQTIYSWVRHVNSGSRNYEASDLYFYLLSCGEIYGAMVYLRKILGLVRDYNGRNFYRAYATLQALGFNKEAIEELTSRILIYRSKYNTLVSRINMFAVPNEFPLYSRRSWLAGLYLQDTSKNDEIIITKLNGMYKFTTRDISGGTDYTGKLEYVPFLFDDTKRQEYALKGSQISGIAGVNSLFALITDAVDTMYLYEDMGIISGDIRKAFDAKTFYMLNTIGDNEWELEPNTQIGDTVKLLANATFVGHIEPTSNWLYQIGLDVHCGNPVLAYAQPVAIPIDVATLTGDTAYSRPLTTRTMIKFYDICPNNPDNVMRLTRGKALNGVAVNFDTTLEESEIGSHVINDYVSNGFAILSNGTELFNTWTTFLMIEGTVQVVKGSKTVTLTDKALVGTALTYMNGYGMYTLPSIVHGKDLENYQSLPATMIIELSDTHPEICYGYFSGGSTKSIWNTGTFHVSNDDDFTQFAIINEELLAQIHAVAFQSLYGVGNIIALLAKGKR